MTLLILFVISMILLLYMWREAFQNRVVEMELSYEHFPSAFGELKLFFVSDIHRRVIAQEIIDKVKDKADFVVIGGDLTERGVPFTRTFENLRRLKEIGQVFFVWGNNDFEVHTQTFRKLLLDSGVIILENSSYLITATSGEKIHFIGIQEISLDLDDLDKALTGINQEDFKIVICHNPAIFKKIEREDNIALVLSGHTHGGQINFFGLGLFPVGRLYRTKKGDLLISNGYGTTSLPLRFWARAETHLITIKRKNI